VVSGAHAGEFDVGKGELTVQMECEPSLAKTATQALVTLWDPGARISAPLWRRTERLSRRVLATLESLELPAGWQEAADRLRRDPLDREAQRAVRELIERPGVADRGNAGAALRAAVEEFEGRNRIVLDTGACHDRTVACPEIDLVRQLADGIVAPLDTGRGNWELTVVLDVRDTTSGETQSPRALPSRTRRCPGSDTGSWWWSRTSTPATPRCSSGSPTFMSMLSTVAHTTAVGPTM
jgi:hypothetical protein